MEILMTVAGLAGSTILSFAFALVVVEFCLRGVFWLMPNARRLHRQPLVHALAGVVHARVVSRRA